jgi:hypothetical protein
VFRGNPPPEKPAEEAKAYSILERSAAGLTRAEHADDAGAGFKPERGLSV